SGAGMVLRLDGGAGYAGAVISPDYDALLVQVTGHAARFARAAHQVHRAPAECPMRRVAANSPRLHNVLNHPRFLSGRIDTRFIDETPELFRFPRRRNRAQRLLRFFGDLAVNGASVPGMQPGVRPSDVDPRLPKVEL